MLRYALRNLARKRLRTGLVMLIFFILTFSTMLINGIIAAREGALRSILRENLAGACMLTTYRDRSAGFDWLSAVFPDRIDAEVLRRMDDARLEYSPRLRLGGLHYRDDGQWSFLTILGVEPERERRVTTGIRIVRGSYPAGGGRTVALPDTYLRDNGLALGQEITLFLRIKEGYLLPFAFVIVGGYTSTMEDVLKLDMRIAFTDARSLQEAVGLPSGSYSDLAFREWSPLIEESAHRDALTYVPAERVIQQSAGFVSFLTIINRVIQCITILILLAAIVNTVLMQIMERKREIGTLYAIGCPPKWVTLAIGIEYLVIEAMAILLSCGLYAAAILLSALFPRTFSVSFSAMGVVSSVGLSTLITVIGITYPCFKASAMSVTELLREEA
jgi:putative ABC transport system permease protein